MPIRFRCPQCRQLLSVSRRKAGTAVACPTCGNPMQVPTIEGIAAGPPPGTAPEESPVRTPATADAEPAQADPLPGETSLPSSEQERELEPAAAAGGATASNAAAAPYSAWDPNLGDWEEHPAFLNRRAEIMHDVLDMTSMVDVTFLLLVFFMITASFSVQKTLQSQAPESDEGSAAAAPPSLTMEDLVDDSVVVEIAADNSIRVDDVPVAGPRELFAVLAAKIGNEGKTELLIEAEYKATHGTVVSVTDVGMQAGMQRVRRVSRGADP